MYEQRSERPVVSLKDLVKSYEDFTLGPLNLEIEPGYVVAVVGPNGSGKSTLFRMLMGLSRPDSGEIEIFGARYPEDEVEIKRRIGYVPEISTGHDEMTAAGLGSFVSHWYPEWSEKLYVDLLQRLEIDTKKRFDRLSKGMQRRLAFALAVARNPGLLLLDEPTDGVDPFARRKMLEEIPTFMEGGDRTVIFATHVMDEVRRVADYVAFLHGGHFLGFYEKDALLESWRVLWVDQVPDSDTPGLVRVENGTPVRIITDSAATTLSALEEQRIKVVRTGPLDLEEILAHLMRGTRDENEAASRT